MGTLLNNSEQTFYDQVNVEVLTLAGTDNLILWTFTKPTSMAEIDCLYGEPIVDANGPVGTNYYPFEVLGLFQKPVRTSDGTPHGLDITRDGVIYFSRKNLEDKNVPATSEGDRVKEGDVFELFSNIPDKRWFFELKKVERDGWENDSDVWTQYICDFVRHDSFIPERKLPDGGAL